MLKANNQPYKKILGLALGRVNVVKNCKILTVKVNFLRQKLSESNHFFHWAISIYLGAYFLLLPSFGQKLGHTIREAHQSQTIEVQSYDF